MTAEAAELRTVRRWLWIFIVCLVLSGLTAFPLRAETDWALALAHRVPAPALLLAWLDRVHAGLIETGERYPFLFYGTDWLAFAHLTSD
ncbi:hypothetical protein [Kitasatospora sp. NBC_01266]|uniref:hypothetical protein n=1 Tax=Kitasatospora sp. NBC_01266 TaxID=2903572 RepID=UPI002E337DBA|nr:hypothetical protein [Kitasatospora sp. NBC_01266]